LPAAHDRTRRGSQLKRERLIIAVALATLTALGWVYLMQWPMPMPGPEGARGMQYALLTVVMWMLMMVAMMTPTVLPVVLLFQNVNRQQPGATQLRTPAFVAGYFSVWLLYSLAAALLQLLWLDLGWIDAMGVVGSRTLTAALMALVGVYQWLPVKAACLAHCRTPIHFLTAHYRRGTLGAWRMGLAHGSYCVACCWLLMLLLFVGGVMNLWWIVGITALTAAERLLPHGLWLARAAGVALIGAAAVIWVR
jgi:predicted metal-binding membrane protein